MNEIPQFVDDLLGFRIRNTIVVEAFGKVPVPRFPGAVVDHIILEFAVSRTSMAALCANQLQYLAQKNSEGINFLRTPPNDVRINSFKAARTRIGVIEDAPLENRAFEVRLPK